jgi:hypothetical protein
MRGGVLFRVRVVGLFISFVPITVSLGLRMTWGARVLYCEGFIVYLFIVLWDIAHAAYMQPLACKKPPCDGVEAQ